MLYFFCILFPPTNLLLGLNSFYVFEKEFSPLDNRITLDVAEITISNMILFLFVSFILYIILGFSITNIFFGEKKIKNKSDNTDYFGKDTYSGENNSSLSFNSNDKTEIMSPRNETNDSTEISGKKPKSKKNYKLKKSEKISNPPPKDEEFNIEDLGKEYMDSENDNIAELDVKIQYIDYIESKAKDQAQNILNKKMENLRKSLWKIKKNKIDTESNKDNPYFDEEIDDIELDIENQVEAQKMRNLRRTVLGTMYRLKEENEEKEDIDKNLKLSNIEYMLEESVVSSTEKYIDLIKEKNSEGNTININNIDNNFNLKYKNEENIKNNIIIEDSSIKPQKKNEKKKEKKEKTKIEKSDIGYINKKKEECKEGSKIFVKNLTKIYENTGDKVLNDISFKLFENEIYALMGQNGEGKSTFVSILSGLKEATSGCIDFERKNKYLESVSKFNILTAQGIKMARQIMGICTQNNNILYNDLTVKENLEFFYSLKCEEEFVSEVRIALRDYQLEDIKNMKVNKLSGGQKRKLMIAIACCRRNEIIILDEPTGGIDITGKREIWEILRNQKVNKIILLITHYMDEAFNLADRIGILKNGKIIFNEEKEKLKEKFGNYIKIQINKKLDKKLRSLPGEIETKFLLKNESSKLGTNNIISETSSKPSSGNLIANSDSSSSNSAFNNERVELKEYKERATIKIPNKDLDVKKINELLDLLEKEYKINNYYIDRTNFDDIFISAVGDKKDYDKKKFMFFFEDHHYDNTKNDTFTKFRKELKIMFEKRFKETIRDKKSFILEILFPIILTFISCLLCFYEILEDNKSVELHLYNMDKNQQSIFYEALNGSNFEEFRNVLSSEMKEEEDKLPNYWFKYIPNVLAEENDSYLKKLVSYYNVIYEYSKQEGIKNNTGAFYFIKADKLLHQYEFNFYISSKKKHSTIFLTNYLLRNIIRYEMKRSSIYKRYMDDIQISNSPFPLTYKEKEDKKGRNGFSLVFFISIALSLIPANFITIILREKENKSKHLQILSGTSIYTYWINNYIFELIKYYVVVGVCLIILFLFKYYEKYLAIIYIFYGPALVSFTYVISYFFNTEASGQITILLVNLFFGSLCGSAVLILRTNKNLKYFGMALSYFFRIVPSFCICYGYNQLISKKILFAIDYFKKDDNQNYEELKKKYFDSSNIIKDPNYISIDIIFLSLEMVIYTLLLIFLENKEYFLWKFGFKKINLDYSHNNSIKISTESKSTKKSKNKVKNNSDNKNTGKTSKVSISQVEENKIYPFEVNKLSKEFNNKFISSNFFEYLFKCCKTRSKIKILDKISFKVSNGECFCLLGANGSGKTTSFKCFSKEIEPEQGDIQVGGINIKDFTKEQPGIGYCPQFDCIFEYLTAKENLMFYAKLKGIKEESSNLIVNTLLNMLDLNNEGKDEEKSVYLLSGGNKRKLSVGISLLCRPTVILMDEPSTGMDPYSRQLLLDLLHNAYLKSGKKNKSGKNRGLILVTHLIQEAELLSDKIGILYESKIKKNKKFNDLLKKESKDIILSVEFKIPSNESLKKEFGDILKEKITKKKDINNFLSKIKREKYIDLFDSDKFGKDIYKGMKKKGWVKKFSILRAIKYLDYVFLLSSKLKNYFESVICVNYILQNFDFRIKKGQNEDRCDSRIFGIVEGCKKECHIEEYTYKISSLENIFLETVGCESDWNKPEFNKLNLPI